MEYVAKRRASLKLEPTDTDMVLVILSFIKMKEYF